MIRNISVIVLCAVCGALAADGTEDAPPIKTATPNKGKLQASEICAFGAIASPVGISVDDQGRVYVTQTSRRTNGELDIRQHMDFVEGSLRSQSVEDRRAFIHANYKKGVAGDANKDGKQDWHDLTVHREKINVLIDADGDGKYEKNLLFADDFHTEVTGVAGGVLAFGGSIYATITPDLWKLSDTQNTNRADKIESIAHGFGAHIGFGGHDMHGPAMGPDGKIYWSMGDKGFNVTTKEGKKYIYPFHGAVFRCDPDGANFEPFAVGLRNVQEVAFDDFGNMFGVDNDGDIGDRERLVYITQGSDSGCGANWQYRNNKKVPGGGGYNPWLAENLFKTYSDTQPAYITPPLANYSDGPCGFKFNPGTALSDEYKGHFFLTQFPKKVMSAFKVDPDGASFKMGKEQVVFSGLMMTGITFGPDGAIYAADWGDNAWAPHDKGRVARIDVPGNNPSAPRLDTKRLLAEGMGKRDAAELSQLLANPDQRVRLRAQFELVDRKSVDQFLAAAGKNDSQLARLHAIWGLGQLARKPAFDAATVNAQLLALLSDSDAEIRAQAAKVLGEAGHTPAGDSLAKLLVDPSPRVRFFAAQALARCGNVSHIPAIAVMVAKMKVTDPFLRHAANLAMSGISANDAKPIADLSDHANVDVRLCAIVALRRLSSPLVEKFLNDKHPLVVVEAARAIHDDFSIPQALPALAKLIDKPLPYDEALHRRIINANLRLGDAESASRLSAFAIGRGPAVLRADAADALAWFAKPPTLDRVEGRYRNLGNRDVLVARGALAPVLAKLLGDSSTLVRSAAVNAITQLDYSEARDNLAKLAVDEKQPVNFRAAAIQAMHALKSPQTQAAVDLAMKSDDAGLRAAARTILAQLQPDNPATLESIKAVLDGNSIIEQQAAILSLAMMKSPQAAKLLESWVDQLQAGKVTPALQLDVIEAAQSVKTKSILDKIKAYQSKKPKNDRLAQSIESLEGGNAYEGELAFASIGACAQCHVLNNTGGNVGPDLTHIASRMPRLKLLESIVNPQATIAEGFATVTITRKDGETISGIVKEQSPLYMILKDDEGNLVKVLRTNIQDCTEPTSAMPPMTDVLRPRDVRNIVEYLTTLK